MHCAPLTPSTGSVPTISRSFALAVAGSVEEIGRRYADSDLVAFAQHSQGRALLRLERLDDGVDGSPWAQISIVGGEVADLEDARERLHELEQAWSPTLTTRDLVRLDARAGLVTAVSADTVLLARLAIRAGVESRGWYDPTPAATHATQPDPTTSNPRLGLMVDAARGEVRLSAGRLFRPEALAYGLAADLIADLIASDLLDAGAIGVCVDVGGHVHADGPAPQPEGWLVAVNHPALPEAVDGLRVRSGGVANLQSRRVIVLNTNAPTAVASMMWAAPVSDSAPGTGSRRKSIMPIEPSSAHIAISGVSSIVRWRRERWSRS